MLKVRVFVFYLAHQHRSWLSVFRFFRFRLWPGLALGCFVSLIFQLAFKNICWRICTYASTSARRQVRLALWFQQQSSRVDGHANLYAPIRVFPLPSYILFWPTRLVFLLCGYFQFLFFDDRPFGSRLSRLRLAVSPATHHCRGRQNSSCCSTATLCRLFVS